MAIKIYKLGLCRFYVGKERGNTYVKDKDGVSKPLQFAIYCDENEVLTLRDYMNLKTLTIKKAVSELEDTGIVLIGHTFSFYFYDMESVEKFLKVSGAVEQ